VRISGGLARGIPLLAPNGDAVRPATDALRQSVFSSLGSRVQGARFLDLYAGTGAYGLEALSRGAAGGLFVERDARAVACLRRNLAAVCKSLGRDERNIGIFPRDALTFPADGEKPPDLIFIDPPYEIIATVAPDLFERLGRALGAKSDAIVVFELPGEMELAPEGWTLIKRLGKGGRRQPTAAFFQK
jgi:16S rRNA (guanine966-N2)-methyltransferase